jgi:hypothetical protein
MDIEQLNKNLQSLDFDKLVSGAITATENDIIKLNREQLNFGFDAEDGQMPFYKSKEYAAYKKSRGSKAGGRVDLKLEYNFQRLFYIKQTKTEIQVLSKDKKAPKLEAMFKKPKIYGLNGPNTIKYANEFFLPVFTKFLRKEITR